MLSDQGRPPGLVGQSSEEHVRRHSKHRLISQGRNQARNPLKTLVARNLGRTLAAEQIGDLRLRQTKSLSVRAKVIGQLVSTHSGNDLMMNNLDLCVVDSSQGGGVLKAGLLAVGDKPRTAPP